MWSEIFRSEIPQAITDVEHPVMYVHPYVLFGQISSRMFSPVFNWIVLLSFLLLSRMCSLYALHINPLSDIWYANISPHSVGCLSISSMVPFAVQQLFSWMRSYLLRFAFVAFGVRFKKSVPRPIIKELTAYVYF